MKHLFTEEGQAHLAAQKLLPSDRFIVDQLLVDLKHYQDQRRDADRRLAEFAKAATLAEQEARAVLASIPCVGPVTIDIVLAELGDLQRFRNRKQVAAYAGLAPKVRESADRRKGGGITKEGSGLLRWMLIQTAWRMVTKPAAGAWLMRNSNVARAPSGPLWRSPGGCWP